MRKYVVTVADSDDNRFFIKSASRWFCLVESLQDAKPTTKRIAEDIIKWVNTCTNTPPTMFIKFKGKQDKNFPYDSELFKTAIIKEVELKII